MRPAWSGVHADQRLNGCGPGREIGCCVNDVVDSCHGRTLVVCRGFAPGGSQRADLREQVLSGPAQIADAPLVLCPQTFARSHMCRNP